MPEDENIYDYISEETYFNLLYFCRLMLYINSAINPILYNIMSSKFRDGFKRAFRCMGPGQGGMSLVRSHGNFGTIISANHPGGGGGDVSPSNRTTIVTTTTTSFLERMNSSFLSRSSRASRNSRGGSKANLRRQVRCAIE